MKLTNAQNICQKKNATPQTRLHLLKIKHTSGLKELKTLTNADCSLKKKKTIKNNYTESSFINDKNSGNEILTQSNSLINTGLSHTSPAT